MQTKYFSTIIKMLLFLLLLFNSVMAQNARIDSLRRLLQTAKDTNRINILNDISCSFYFTNNDSVITYANQAYNESKLINYLKGVSVSLVRSRVYAQEKGDVKAIEHYLVLQIPLSIQLRDYNGVVTSYELLASSFQSRGLYKKALETFDSALKYVPLTYDDCRGLGFRYTDNDHITQLSMPAKDQFIKQLESMKKHIKC